MQLFDVHTARLKELRKKITSLNIGDRLCPATFTGVTFYSSKDTRPFTPLDRGSARVALIFW